MKSFKVTIPFFSLALLLGLNACEKEGPIGPSGPQGEQGVAGPKGDKGAPGTANVIYSDWILPTNATYNIYNTSTVKEMEISEPKITEEIRTKGVVLVYYSTNNGSTFPLPYSLVYSNGEVARQYTHFIRGAGLLRIRIASYGFNILPNDYLYDPPPAGGAHHARFRYVIIPGGVAAKAKVDGIDLNDFNAVAEVFGIPR